MTDLTRTLRTDRADITRRRWHVAEPGPLAAGQVRFGVEHFGFSANNVTYAALGGTMKYWDVFPTDDPAWGCVPVWGYAVATESRCDDVAAGLRVYGFLPFATEVVMTPTQVRPHGFVDAAGHRAAVHPMYSSYSAVAGDPGHPAALEGYEALLRPLFLTSFLIADWLADQGWFGAESVLLSSASSKTAYGTAHALRQHPAPRPEVVGLTSSNHVAATQRLGLYDRVLAYEDIASLDRQRASVYIDLSGSADIRLAVHTRCGGLRHSCAVGITHWRAVPADAEVPGPTPMFFFAPAELQRQVGAHGREEFLGRAGAAMGRFVDVVSDPDAPLLDITWHHGPDAALAVYDAVVAGTLEPAQGPMISW